MYQHPNLLAWRSMLQQLDADAQDRRVVAVFIKTLQDAAGSPYDAVLRAQIARGDRSTLYA